MDSRSSSSSPDPLEHPGDPKYLLSSATKPFSVRQTTMSPRKPRTPRQMSPLKAVKRSAQSIKFDDIFLPATPSGRGRGRNTPSPTRAMMQGDGNISPWRIRVTVEAEREDEDENNTVGGKQARVRSMKVPLKGGFESVEPTPKRRRRSGKTDVSQRVATPGRRTKTALPESSLNTGEKKKRGRPRKSTPARQQDTATPKETFADSVRKKMREEDPFFDIAQGTPAPGGAVPEMMSSSMSSREDEHVALLNSINNNNQFPIINAESLSHGPSGRKSDTSSLPKQSSPPRSSPIPLRRRGVSPENTIHAGHTPGAKTRLYPTPTTSSSLIGDDGVDNPARHSPGNKMQPPKSLARRLADPTDEHREFDSILESEGFSMVSLDTLPSAKQQLNSFLTDTPNSIPSPPHGSLLMQGNPSTVSSKPEESHQSLMAASSVAGLNGLRAQPTQSTVRSSLQHVKDNDYRTPAESIASPQQPPAPAPAVQSPNPLRKRPWARVIRVVRAGIALQGVLVPRRRSSRLQSPFSSPNYPRLDESEAARRRLEELFQGLGPETQRELRAGLRFGEELTKRLREEKERVRQEAEMYIPQVDEGVASDDSDGRISPVHAENDINAQSEILSEGNVEYPHIDDLQQPETPQTHEDHHAENGMDSEMVRWQREREAVSRQIQRANSSQVIVIDSDDDDAPMGTASHVEEKEAEGELQEEQEEIDDYGNNDMNEDEYEDIWQQEARDPRSNSTSFASGSHEEVKKPRRSELPRSWKGGENEEYSLDEDISPELYWAARRNRFPIQSAQTTQMARFRDENAELSSLLGTPESETRRFYQENPTPENESGHHPLQAVQHSDDVEPYSPSIDDVPQQSARTPQSTHPSESSSLSAPSLRHTSVPLEAGSASGDRHSSGRLTPASSTSVGRQDQQMMQPPRETPTTDVEMDSPSLSLADVNQRASPRDEPEPEPEGYQHETSEGATAPTSWFRKMTDFAPAWLGSPPRRKARNMQPVPSRESATLRKDRNQVKNNTPAGSPTLSPQSRPSKLQPQAKKQPLPHKALAISGYFTDDHYVALRRLYRKAKQSPDSFTYVPTSSREALVGQSLSTADGLYGRRVTETQFAIIDEFRDQLIRGNRRQGGSGQIGWGEEELLHKLIGIIIGEQIRRERQSEGELTTQNGVSR
ncbi:hypothetical protein AJ80_02565 [Polytolypa hystricis UAMH7299]|uniref:AT DNA binding protein n=1 Tax=Polytolypa hystricis (strain UAMH7299) TaxID=1447883 RepID=A0A2B7YQQ2_POLH7|nr:hypothetical protein AJ80_02565 [Polytolypa hystricis UAMH7299]